MLKTVPLKIAEIYVPTKLAKTLAEAKAEELPESILTEGQKTPIQVRPGDGRYVLITGLHRLEAMKALGEDAIDAVIVQSRKF